MEKISAIVSTLRAGVSPVCDTATPSAGDYGVLELSAVTRGEVCAARAKRLAASRVQDDWPRIREGTILVCRASGNRALVGACVLVKQDMPMLIPPDTAWILDLSDGYSPRVLVEYLRSSAGRRAIHRIARGTNGTWKISQQSFLSLPLPASLPAAGSKAEALSKSFDHLDAQLRNLIAAKRTFQQALAQQLLAGKKRFPAFRGEPWSEVWLGDVFEERAETNRDDLPLLSVTGDRGIIPRDQLAKRDTSNADKSKYKRVTVGDIAYNTMRMWQGVSALSSLEGIVSPAYTVVVPTSKIDGEFAKHLFKFPPVVHLFHRHSQGLVDDTLNLKYKRFAKIRLRIPASVEEQKKIAEVLDLCDAELALLEEQRQHYEDYKRGLMQRLLSGEIQVPT